LAAADSREILEVDAGRERSLSARVRPAVRPGAAHIRRQLREDVLLRAEGELQLVALTLQGKRRQVGQRGGKRFDVSLSKSATYWARIRRMQPIRVYCNPIGPAGQAKSRLHLERGDERNPESPSAPGLEDLPLPRYMSEHAAGLDLLAANTNRSRLRPRNRLIPTGLYVRFRRDTRDRCGLGAGWLCGTG